MEQWDARHADGRLAGFRLIRGKSIPRGYYHLVVEITVRHTDGSFLLMQRDHTKLDFPGYHEASASGSALAGETALQAAKRELAEETGIRRGEFTELYRQTTDVQAIFVGFLCVTDWPKDNITLQAGETIDFRWLSRAEFLDYFSDGLIPYQRDRLSRHLDFILNR
ncbi:MAG TPA: NUDIX domain-containing protein [Tissierellia bacterium]|nr:NUDIX domain-containing protein [Tissierellia bacterium]